MHALVIRNTVHDYDAWRAAFDGYERLRRDRGVRGYRLLRRVDDSHEVTVVLDFDDEPAAAGFRTELARIWATPRSRDQLVRHPVPELVEVVEHVSW